MAQELEDALENQAETGQLAVFRRQSSGDSTDQQQQIVPYSSEKRIVHQSRKHKRIIDQENTEVIVIPWCPHLCVFKKHCVMHAKETRDIFGPTFPFAP